MLDTREWASPFPERIPGISTYVVASEFLGTAVPESVRVTLWGRVSLDQALSLIAQVLTDLEVESSLSDVTVFEIDQRWAARVANPRLRVHLQVGSQLGVRLFAPQILLLAAKEAVLHCPAGAPGKGVEGLDWLVYCLLGIAEEKDASRNTKGVDWGGMDVALASELIANSHFNRTLWLGRQLTWFDRTWFKKWPKRIVEAERVGGEPWELFKEATGIELVDFAAIAFNLYTQTAVRRHVRFPDQFFVALGLDERAVEHFLSVTSCSVTELRESLEQEAAGGESSRFGFDAFRHFPLIRLDSGELIMLSPNFMMQRALSETAFLDVSNYLQSVSPARRQDFLQLTKSVLEFEAGAALRRIFYKRGLRVLDEDRLQKRLASGRKNMPSLCDYAIQSGRTWLLVEVTDRPIPRPVVFANASAKTLDLELDHVLVARKVKQLASTMALLREEAARQGSHADAGLTFIPLVLTGETGLPWAIPVRNRVRERLKALGYDAEFCSSVALITLKELIMLENTAALGHDVVALLRSWREDNPSLPLDQHVAQSGIILDSPPWEKNRVSHVVNEFVKRMKLE